MSDIDTAAADSLKVLDPKRPIREADIRPRDRDVCFGPQCDICSAAIDRGLLRYVLPNFCQQFARAVGLGHKVVAASRPCLLFFPTRRKRGDSDDWDR